MQTVSIPNCNLLFSEIGLGTSHFGTHTDRDTAFRILDRWIEAGGNVIDTAHIYGASRSDEPGPSEETIGAWIASRNARDRIILCTKGAHPDINPKNHRNGPPRLRPSEWEQDLDRSLDSLQTDTIDLYFLHRDDPAVPVPEILDALEDCVRLGRIRFYGCSNWSAPRIREASRYAEQKQYRGFLFDQLAAPLARMNPLFLSATDMTYLGKDLLSFHTQSGMPVMSAMSLANGYFHRKLNGKPLSFFQRITYQVPGNGKIAKKLKELDQNGIPLGASLGRFIRSWPFPAVVLAGFSSVDQLNRFLSEYDTPVPDAVLQELHALRDPR